MVISARNPVHSVLFLILAFVNAAGPVRADGRRIPGDDPDRGLCRRRRRAVPVRGDDARRRFRRAQAGRAAISADRHHHRRHLRRRADASSSSAGRSGRVSQAITSPIPPIAKVSNTEAIGLVLYTRYVYYFEAAGLILLVAMVGAIVLTLQHRVRVRRQSIAEQVARTPATAIEIRHVRPGQGWGTRHDHHPRPLSRRRRDPVHASACSAFSSTARTSSSS